MSSWLNLVKKVSKENKGGSLKESLKKASKIWKTMKKRITGKKSKKMGGEGELDIIPAEVTPEIQATPAETETTGGNEKTKMGGEGEGELDIVPVEVTPEVPAPPTETVIPGGKGKTKKRKSLKSKKSKK